MSIDFLRSRPAFGVRSTIIKISIAFAASPLRASVLDLMNLLNAMF
jgi:hypothetical protein